MPRRHAIVTAAGLFCGLVWSAGSVADGAKGSTWARGLELYKQSKFAAACPLFARAAASAPENGAIWADLGLCELRRGDRPASIHASLLAARFGNERVRKNAYFNLYLAGYALELPEECAALGDPPTELACDAPAFACTADWHAYGSAEGTNGAVAVFASSANEARAGRNDMTSSAGASGPGAVALSEARLCFHTWCELNGWRCDDSAVVGRRTSACFERALGPPPKDLCVQPSPACDQFQKCQRESCAAAENAIVSSPGAKPWPSVVREHDERIANCVGGCVEGDTLSCSVVVVDPCQNRIGYVCSTPNAKTKGEEIQAGEVPFAG